MSQTKQISEQGHEAKNQRVVMTKGNTEVTELGSLFGFICPDTQAQHSSGYKTEKEKQKLFNLYRLYCGDSGH